jgi:hypothetical protein
MPYGRGWRARIKDNSVHFWCRWNNSLVGKGRSENGLFVYANLFMGAMCLDYPRVMLGMEKRPAAEICQGTDEISRLQLP